MKRYILPILLAAFLFSGCMQTVSVPVMQPAPLHVDNHIQTVVVIDRVAPESRLLSRVESLLTGTTPGLERDAAQSALDGLVATLENSPRFNVIRSSESLATPSYRGNWPEPLDWRDVELLCDEYDGDAVISLETFNSDFVVTDGSRVVEQTDSDGNTAEVTEYFAEGIATLKLGFRLYDPDNRSIADAHMFDHRAAWDAAATSLQEAMAQLINQRNAVMDTSFDSGSIYAERISPQWITVQRQFFKRGGNDAFQLGVRRASVNDWDGATEAWDQSIESTDRKTAGRSAYNLALMHEINGDLERARELAQRAYTDYNIGKARSYVSALERRIHQQAITDQQLN